MIAVLQHDETETGSRLRKTLMDIHDIKPILVRGDIGGLLTRSYTEAKVDLYRYERPSNGQTIWFIEAELFFPPDVQLWRSYALDSEPNDDQIREIVAADAQKGSVI